MLKATRNKNIIIRWEMYYLIAVGQYMMCCNQTLVNDNPIRILRSLQKQISQMRNWNVGLIGAVDQICKENDDALMWFLWLLIKKTFLNPPVVDAFLTFFLVKSKKQPTNVL